MKKAAFYLFICTIIVSCIKVEEIQPIPKYSVFGILNASDSITSVFIGKTFVINENFPIDSGKAINGALAQIKGENIVINLQQNKKNKKYEALTKGLLRSGEKYELEIKINGDLLKGETKLPEIPILNILKAEILNSYAQILVSWNKSKKSNLSYRLFGNVDVKAPTFILFYWGTSQGLWKTKDENTKQNTIYSPVGNFNFVEPFKNAEVEIVLQALDENWNDFNSKLDAVQLRTTFSKKFEAPIFFNSNVSNAVGVFGSLSETSKKINLNK